MEASPSQQLGTRLAWEHQQGDDWRCKHKHIEHTADTHACAKSACQCQQFDSPWVCNCDHAWSEHKQVEVQKQLLPAAATLLEAVADLNRWDLLKRGQEGDGGKQQGG
ncbi:hypothetical protein N2152v2_007245 [Parachlorella kessleri]